MRTALYARYSAGPRQTDQSIEGQIRVCTDYCKQHGLTITEIYADKHISGKTDERPEFQRLIADSKKKKFDAVVVYKTDRFARNKYDSAIYKRQLKINGIKIYYAAETIPDGPEGIILESLMEGLAEYYSAELSQKIKRGLHESALKCKIIGNTIPLGYCASKDNTFEIDPEGAKIVQSIFEMYIAGETNATICSRLNSLGLKTSRGNAFNKNSINRIISNEKYIGIYESAGVRIEGGIPSIISKETFYLAQKEKEKKRVGKSKRQPRAEYLLAGKLYCGHCKKLMTGVSGTGKSGKKFHCYYCQTVRKKGHCNKTHVKADYIENLVVKKTVEFLMHPTLLKDISHKILILQSENSTRKDDIAYFNKKLQENKKATDNIIKAVEKGLGTNSLLERLQSLESEKIAIEGELAYYKSTDFGLSEEQIYFFLESFLKLDDNWEDYKRKIISCFINKVLIYNDKLIVYYNIKNSNDLEYSEIDIDKLNDIIKPSVKQHTCSTEGAYSGDEGN